jgi:DNA-binding MarR family transcriptional regulator
VALSDDSQLNDVDYARIADFRHALRRFLFFSEQAAAKESLKPQQHQALLVIRGRPAGTTTVGDLAERLCVKHHTAVGLVQRLEMAGLVDKTPHAHDRRVMVLQLTAEGSARLERLTKAHRAELKHLGPEIQSLLTTLDRS